MRSHLSVVSILCSLTAIFCFDSYYKYYCHSALWLGVTISFISVVYVISKSATETDRLFAILTFAAILRMLFVLRVPFWGFPIESDSSFNLQLSSLINEHGKLYFGMGFERVVEYSFHPALNIWSAILSQASALSLTLIAKLIFPILSGSLLLVFYYLSVRSVLSEKEAPWACLVLTFTPTFIFFDVGYTKESFALMFFALFLYLIFRSSKNNNTNSLVVIGFLSAFLVAFAHHWSAYNILITLSVIWLFPLAYASILGFFHRTTFTVKRFISPQFYVSILCIVFSWLTFVAFGIFSGHLHRVKEFYAGLLAEYHHYPSMPFLSYGEKITVYAGYLLLATFGIIELLKGLMRKDKTSKEFVLESWFMFCSVYIVLLTYFSPAGYIWASISHRVWIFAFLGLAPLTAASVARKTVKSSSTKWLNTLRRYKPVLLILPLISAILLSPPEIYNPSFKRPGYSYYVTAMWMRESLPEATIATDFYAWNVLVPYGRLNYYKVSSPYILDISVFAKSAYSQQNFDFTKNLKTFIFNKEISAWFDVAANSSVFDAYHNKIYDSEPLTIYILPSD